MRAEGRDCARRVAVLDPVDEPVAAVEPEHFAGLKLGFGGVVVLALPPSAAQQNDFVANRGGSLCAHRGASRDPSKPGAGFEPAAHALQERCSTN